MAQTTITARVDSSDKSKFDKFCSNVGINTSTAINMFVKAVLRENRIPFELSADPFYSKENMAELERRVADIRSGKSTLKEHELIG